MNKIHAIPFSNILLIGHSLGGQISGFVGKLVNEKVGKKLPRIIAMDPAGPLFDIRPENKRLNKNDAEIVEVIHSDGGTFGFLKSCGTIDFFPNGGSSQPGCKRIDLLDITSVVEPGESFLSNRSINNFVIHFMNLLLHMVTFYIRYSSTYIHCEAPIYN